MPYFGSSFKKEEIEKELIKSSLKYEYLGDEAYKKGAKKIVEGKIGAIFQGRTEFGPRALGNRSIIASVQDRDIQKKINSSIKNRPLFQPFCPSILAEEKERLFEKAYLNKHMTIAFRLKEEFKEDIPGSIHIDSTARVQFVEEKDNPNYYNLIKEVKNLTGFGVIINTSFNKHGRTMVLNPKQAIIDFLDTNLDFMIMEGFWVSRC
jgi:carbamoyltransferase